MKNLVVISLLVMVMACGKSLPEPASAVPPQIVVIPEGFPPMEFPEENAFTFERWELGKRLFFDKAMSRDSSLSCGTCHLSDHAFASLEPTNSGVDDLSGTRNVPSLANVGYHPYYTREGGVPTLEAQVFVPVQEHNEFDFNMLLLQERLATNDDYQTMSQKAYSRPMDAFAITRALATFQRSLISGNSSYDRYQNGDLDALTENQVNGMDLFFSQSNQCSGCHAGFNFTDYSIVNNGLYLDYEDSGLERLTHDPADIGKFKVASLRNVALTPPYMHDGSLQSLEEVIDHYISGGQDHPNKSGLLEPLALTAEEKSDLIDFLYALSDDSFVQNQLFQNE